MKYIVQINDKRYEVEVERGNATLISTTDAVNVAPQTADMAKAAPAAPAPAPAPAAQAPAAAPAAPVAAPAAPAANIGEGTRVEAPMPGTIVKINVTQGQSVKQGEILVILEAMKMENEILAPADGKVSQIIVSSGATVSSGDPLIILN